MVRISIMMCSQGWGGVVHIGVGSGVVCSMGKAMRRPQIVERTTTTPRFFCVPTF